MNVEEAKEKVRAALKNIDYEIDESEIIETTVAWYIPYKSIRPLSVYEMYGGAHAGYIVGKTHGDLHKPGSAYPVKKWLLSYELGLLDGPHDLVITRVNNIHTAKQYLEKLHLVYHIPEVENGTTWRIPRTFSGMMIEKRLRSLPCQFKNQRLHASFETFSEIRRLKILEYELVKNTTSKSNEIGETMS